MDRFLEHKNYHNWRDIISDDTSKIVDLVNASLGHDKRFSWVADKYKGIVDIYYENYYVLTITTLSVAGSKEKGNEERLFGILVNWENNICQEWREFDPDNTYCTIDLGRGIYMVKKKSELVDLKFSGNSKESSEYLLKFSLNFNPNE